MSRFPITGKNMLRLIPQREPVVLVSSLEAYTETSLLASYVVPRRGIFVSEGCLIESGLLEHMAQSVALHTGYSYFLRNEEAPTGYIGAMPKLEIFGLPKVGERVFSKVEILQEFMGITLVSIETRLDGELIACARMKTVIAQDEPA